MKSAAVPYCWCPEVPISHPLIDKIKTGQAWGIGPLFTALHGPAARQVGAEEASDVKWPQPSCPCGVIAGVLQHWPSGTPEHCDRAQSPSATLPLMIQPYLLVTESENWDAPQTSQILRLLGR